MWLPLAAALALGGWQVHTAAPVVAAPLATRAGVIVGDTGGTLSLLDPSTGRTRWSVHLRAGIWAPPAVAGSLLIVTVGNPAYVAYDPPSYALAGPGYSGIAALDGASGALVWQFGAAASAASAVAVADGLAIYHDGSGEIVARDARTGAYRWRRFVGSIAARAGVIAIGNGEVASSGAFPNAIVVVRARDGKLVRRIDLPGDARGLAEEPLAFGGGLLFDCYTMRDGAIQRLHLVAVDASTGRVRYDRDIGSGRAGNPTRVVVARDLLVLGSPFTPRLRAFDARDGTERWSTMLPERALGGVAVRGDRLYAADASGTVGALDARTGAFLGNARVGGDLAASTPAALDACLAIGSAADVACLPYARIGGAPR